MDDFHPRWPLPFVLVAAFAVSAGGTSAGPFDPGKAERGRAALTQGSYLAGVWTRAGYDSLWTLWDDVDAAPADYQAEVARRYGLHAAPFDNGDLPLGLKPAQDGARGVVIDCMLCHGGSILGRSYVGLGNTTLDFTALAQDMTRASGLPVLPGPFPANRHRGVTNAGAMGIFVIAMRNEDLSRRLLPLPLGWQRMPDLDAPAWWLLKKKRTMYQDGGMAAESTRSLMQFLLGLTRTEEDMAELEPTFDDIRHYLLSLEAPAYPFAVDAALAEQGSGLFSRHCAECHGTYGASWTYPNRIVPIDEVGTDATRYEGITEAAREHYNQTWYGIHHRAEHTDGYQAPPLDGVWATAPYLHNGSVPTLWHLLKSTERPSRYERIRSTDESQYDPRHVGWNVEVLPADFELPKSPRERRGFYDAADFGMGNEGHTFGDALSDEERWALIEYLKTL